MITLGRTEHDRLILAALQTGRLTAADVMRHTGLGSGTVYAGLMRLESEGSVASEFSPGPWPRRRVYRLVPESAARG